VRAFQVAPAELEGHLLRYPDIADVCVVGIPDEYSGELPFAFVVLSANAAKRATSGDAEKIKADIIKVSIERVMTTRTVSNLLAACRRQQVEI
jgi:4-coumarate--CoA ligase